jgi:hypothetical protein
MNDIKRPFKLGQPVTFYYGQQMVVGTMLQYDGYKRDEHGETQATIGIVNLGNGKALAVPIDILAPLEANDGNQL